MKDPYGVLELTRKLSHEPTIGRAVHIMQWELGDLSKSYVYSQWHPDLAPAYRGEAKKALADLIFQCHVVAALLDESPGKLLGWGIEIVEDRIKEMEAKIGRFESYKGDITDGRQG